MGACCHQLFTGQSGSFTVYSLQLISSPVDRLSVEAAAASPYVDNSCCRFPIAVAAAIDHPWHMDIDERNVPPENSSSKHHGTVSFCCRLFVAPDICG